MITNFDDFEISEELKRAVSDMGFETPTQIQSEVIPQMLDGHDILAEAPTGTGKTCAFALPIITNTPKDSKDIKSLILCPTRELVIQIANEFKKFLKYTESIRVCAVYGGQNIDRQLANLRKKPQIVIATPGRALDHIERRTIKLHNITCVTLDEADEMLDMGFKPDIDKILKACPKYKQIAMFSATMPKPILKLAEEYQVEPIKIASKSQERPHIEQIAIKCKEADKIPFITDILDINDYKLCICFCNTKKRTEELAKILCGFGYVAESLHGDLKQSMRDKIMKRYRAGEINILVATDVAARGIDVSDIDAIFNFDPPIDEEFYVHRIGRTARAKKTGVAYTFYTKGQKHLIENFERITQTQMTKMDNMQASRDFGSKKLANIFKSIDKNRDNTKDFLLHELEKFNSENGTQYTPLDLLAVVIDGNSYMQMSEDKGQKKKQKDEQSKVNSTRFFVTIGEIDGATEKEFENFVVSKAKITKEDIVEIKMLEKFSFVEVKAEFEQNLLALKDMRFNGRKINVEVAGEKANSSPKGKSNKSSQSKSKGNALKNANKAYGKGNNIKPDKKQDLSCNKKSNKKKK